jgi:hypothetical protein
MLRTQDSGILILLAILVLLPLVSNLFAEVFIKIVNTFHHSRHKTGNGSTIPGF